MADSAGSSSQHWFVMDLVEKIFEGPVTLTDLKKMLIDKKVYWSDIAMCPAKDFSWVRLFEIKELTDQLCPPLPAPDVLKHFRTVGFKQTSYVRTKVPEKVAAPQSKPEPQAVRVSAPAPTPVPAPAPAPAPRVQPSLPRVQSAPPEWHLLIDDNEGGPFTLKEIEIAFKAGKKPERAFIWREGMKRWKPIGKIPEFKHLNLGSYGSDFAEENNETKTIIENKFNMRRSFRKSFVAHVLRISETGIRQMIGVCGNITEDGISVMQDTLRVRYPVGSQHRLEIRPLKQTKVPPFKVTAEVRWMNPDNHSIGFQFMDMGNAAQLLKRYFSVAK